MKIFSSSRKAQVTIFIILALIIVVLIFLIFLLRKPQQPVTPDDMNPNVYIHSCSKEAILEAVDKLNLQGGDIKPSGSVKYNNKDITYLCYTSKNYELCINQRPLLIEHLENEIKNYISPKLNECFLSLKTKIQSRYPEANLGNDMGVKIKLSPKKVNVIVSREFSLKRGDVANDFKEFDYDFDSRIYDLAKIANEIVNQEARYCNFDNIGFMILYPEYQITKFKTGDSDTIYSVKERSTNQEFTFAIRGCVIPPGV